MQRAAHGAESGQHDAIGIGPGGSRDAGGQRRGGELVIGEQDECGVQRASLRGRPRRRGLREGRPETRGGAAVAAWHRLAEAVQEPGEHAGSRAPDRRGPAVTRLVGGRRQTCDQQRDEGVRRSGRGHAPQRGDQLRVVRVELPRRARIAVPQQPRDLLERAEAGEFGGTLATVEEAAVRIERRQLRVDDHLQRLRATGPAGAGRETLDRRVLEARSRVAHWSRAVPEGRG